MNFYYLSIDLIRCCWLDGKQIGTVPMALHVALPKHVQDRQALTFVLGTSDGRAPCDLNCPGCLPFVRKEDVRKAWCDAAYRFVVRDCVTDGGANLVAVQAFEPLLSAIMPTTFSIMHEAYQLRTEGHDVETSIVTNGSHIADYLGILSWMAGNGTDIHVTFAGATKASHDQWRRQRDQENERSSFDDLMHGLAEAHATRVPGTHRVVSDHVTAVLVLLPRRNLTETVVGLPTLLRSVGVSRLVVQPFIAIGTNPGKHIIRGRFANALAALEHECAMQGVMLEVDDLYRALQDHEVDLSAFVVQANKKPFVRWLPDGRCTTADNFLSVVDETLPRWLPEKDGPTPGELFRELLGSS